MRKSATIALFALLFAASVSARGIRRAAAPRPDSPPIFARIWQLIQTEIRGLVPASPTDGHTTPPSSPAPAPTAPIGG
jgi:hypothetical protein